MRTASYLLWVAISLVGAAACAKKKDAAPSPESGVSGASGGDATAAATKPDDAAAKPVDDAAAAKPDQAQNDEPVLVASNGPVPSKPTPSSPSKAAAMKPGFEKAYTSFIELAATDLGVSAEEVQAGPGRADIKVEQALGKAWAFTGVPKGAQAPRQVRGWAVADGTVITTKQNLGLLLKEAGLWSKKPLKFDKIAKAITWGLGPNYTWGTGVDYPPNLNPWPELSLDKKGAGTFSFAVDGREPGPGGAGGGPVTTYKLTIALAADHTATLSLAKP